MTEGRLSWSRYIIAAIYTTSRQADNYNAVSDGSIVNYISTNAFQPLKAYFIGFTSCTANYNTLVSCPAPLQLAACHASPLKHHVGWHTPLLHSTRASDWQTLICNIA